MVIITALAAIGTTIAASAFGAAIGIAGVTGTLALAAIGLATNVVLGMALNALTPKPSVGGSNRGYQVNSRGSALDHQIIYGKVRVGGAILYEESTGTDNLYFHRIIGIAGHEVTSFDEIYINDELATIDLYGNVTSPSRYNNKVRINLHLGSSDQSADVNLVSESAKWTSAHRLRGIAYMYVRFAFDTDVFPNGVPIITATVKGKKVYNPATGLTAWSDNPALCLRDYLTTQTYGLGELSENVDDTLVIASASVCAETNTNAGTSRYTCNGAFTTAVTPYDMINGLLTSMGGSLWYSQGKWRMKPSYWTAPTLFLNEDDLRSPVGVSTRHSRRDNFNAVKGTFRGAETNWQATDYPEVTNAAFVAADNGQVSVVDIDLPFTDNSVEARRISRIALESNRQQIIVSASFGLRALEVQVGDNVTLTNSRFGWSNKVFQVVSWTFGLTDGLDLQVEMILKETSASVFDEVDDGIVYERDNTNLLSPFEVPEVGLSLEVELRIVNQEVFGVINVEVQNESSLADYYEVQFKKSSDTGFKLLGSGTAKNFDILIPEDDTYDVRARAVNYLGVKGKWTTFSGFSATSFSSPPEDVVDFSANVSGGTAQLTWKPVSDLDISHYEIRYSTVTSGAVWSQSVVLIDKVGRPATSASASARQGSYLIKAVDKLGNKSVNQTTTVILTNLNDIIGLNFIQSYIENPSFNGSKSNCVAVTDEGSVYLTLDTSMLFEGLSGNFDEALGLFDGGGGNVVSQGTYDFENILDLGDKYSVMASSSIIFSHLDYVNTFDSAFGLFEGKSGLFDGDPDALDGATAKVQISYTDDDPSLVPVWSLWQDFTASTLSARAYRFRAVLSTSDPSMAPKVTGLSSIVDMPDIVQSKDNINFTGTTNVVFPSEFYTTVNPALGLSITGLGSGDYYTITSKDYQGFTITVYDSSNTQLTTPTELDYVVKGFGKRIPT